MKRHDMQCNVPCQKLRNSLMGMVSSARFSLRLESSAINLLEGYPEKVDEICGVAEEKSGPNTNFNDGHLLLRMPELLEERLSVEELEVWVWSFTNEQTSDECFRTKLHPFDISCVALGWVTLIAATRVIQPRASFLFPHVIDIAGCISGNDELFPTGKPVDNGKIDAFFTHRASMDRASFLDSISSQGPSMFKDWDHLFHSRILLTKQLRSEEKYHMLHGLGIWCYASGYQKLVKNEPTRIIEKRVDLMTAASYAIGRDDSYVRVAIHRGKPSVEEVNK